jgi:hypothetical protein
VSCDVVYGDRFQSWRSHTRDISLSGCRVVGYYPFPVGKTLALKITHPGIPEPVAMVGKVVQLYGGAENALGLVFEKDPRAEAKLEQWMRKVIASDPAAERTITRTPGELPIEAQLRRASTKSPGRLLSAGERAVIERLAKGPRGISLHQLRTEWGVDWERRAQVLFDLIADGIVAYTLPATDAKSAVDDAAIALTTSKTTQKLMEDLESEYGPLDKRFAKQLETITQEVIGWHGADGTQHRPGASSQSGLKPGVMIRWISDPLKKG